MRSFEFHFATPLSPRPAIFFAGLLALTLLSCRTEPQPPTNILIIVVDTLRADKLGCYGNDRGLTPFLDELCRRGVVFKNAYAASSWTVPSVATLLTSRYPSQHGVGTFDAKLGEQEVTLAEKVRELGYETIGVTANFRLTKELGYAQGFDKWRTFPTSGRVDSPVKVRGPMVRGAARKLLGLGAPGAKHFVYLQFMEPHVPYEPPEPFHSRFRSANWSAEKAAAATVKMGGIDFKAFSPEDLEILEALYDGEVATIDDELRSLFTELEQIHLLDDAVVVITADHGEEFHEHGKMGHGHDLYNETISVPLIFLLPHDSGGRVVEENVSLLDVAPTVLDLAGVPSEPSFEGRSLLRFLRPGVSLARQGSDGQELIIELPPTGSKLDLRRHDRAILRDSVKLLTPSRPRYGAEVFDLNDDPGEKNPNPASLAAQSDSLRRTLATRIEQLSQSASNGETAEVDEATKEKLRALGYNF
jgi:arylsulfatase A-like enzyme